MRLWKAVEGNFNCRRRKKIAGNLPAIFFWSESVSLEQPARSVVKPWPNGAEGHAQNKKSLILMLSIFVRLLKLSLKIAISRDSLNFDFRNDFYFSGTLVLWFVWAFS